MKTTATTGKSFKDDELLSKLVSYFETFEESTREARKLAERDRDYVDHLQLDDAIIRELKKRKQPPTINNRIRKKINYLRGLERMGRTDPKAFPRTPNHEEDANAVTDALRYVADNAQFDEKRSSFFESYLIEGTGGIEIVVSKNKSRDIELPSIPFDRLWYDHHSMDLGFSDAKYKGMIIWADTDDLKNQFPGASDILDESLNEDFDAETFDDKPHTKWVDKKRKRVRITQLYYQDKGVWWLAFYTKAGFMLEPTQSPWLDEDGEPQCGIELRSLYINRKGDRFGEPRFMIEQQDSINKRESKMLDLTSRRQTYGNEKSGINTRANKTALNQSDGHVKMVGDSKFGVDFGVIPTGDMAAGQFTLLQEAKQGLDETSVSGASTGTDTGDSGRAILAKQSGNQVELAPIFDGKRFLERQVYRQVWNRIRQFWTEERWIRVTDNDKNVKFVGLNQPITLRQAAGPQLEAEFGQIPPEFENDPRLNQVVGIQNEVSQIDVDIIVEDSPDVATIQLEEFEKLANLAQMGVVFKKEVYLAASQLRDKDKLIEMENGGDNPEAQAAAQEEQQMAKKLSIDAEQAKIKKDNASAAKSFADAESKVLENSILQSQIESAGI